MEKSGDFNSCVVDNLFVNFEMAWKINHVSSQGGGGDEIERNVKSLSQTFGLAFKIWV